MDENDIKKALLNGKKDERIISTVTSVSKKAIGELAEEECTTVSDFLIDIAAQEIMRNTSKLYFAKPEH